MYVLEPVRLLCKVDNFVKNISPSSPPLQHWKSPFPHLASVAHVRPSDALNVLTVSRCKLLGNNVPSGFRPEEMTASKTGAQDREVQKPKNKMKLYDMYFLHANDLCGIDLAWSNLIRWVRLDCWTEQNFVNWAAFLSYSAPVCFCSPISGCCRSTFPSSIKVPKSFNLFQHGSLRVHI